MEIISFVVLALLIVISPGADFVLVFKNSVIGGRKAGVVTGIGIGVGVCIHVTYSIVGISYLFSQNETAFNILKYAGSAYLIYLGFTGLFSSKLIMAKGEDKKPLDNNFVKCFLQGFLCNTLNPKTVLFFLSVFSQLITQGSDNNLFFLLLCGLYIVLLHIAWFYLVSFFVTSSKAIGFFERFGRKINQVCALGLIAFGLTLIA
ncbi:LysE family translocator [Pseudoalteromonas rhizosphaerae]|uniref:LysE family translocator n=1 Tax=Pseudoalteromonas rhizosphaerae TaxID=2518973 RepID=A0ABW8KZN4_9GAMM